MSFLDVHRKTARALVTLSVAAVGSAASLGIITAPASAVDGVGELADVATLTETLDGLPLASALPSQVTSLPQAGTLSMKQDGATRELPVQPVAVQRNSKQFTALPVVPGQDLADTSSLPVANALPGTGGLDKGELSKISWVLQQTSGTTGLADPTQGAAGLDDLADPNSLTGAVDDAAGLQVGPLSSADLSKQEAITATQAAVWHYSTGADLDTKRHSANEAKLYSYLTSSKNTGTPLDGQLPEMNLPTAPGLPSTNELPVGVQELPGTVFGPLSLAEGVESAEMENIKAPEGVSVVDEAGNKTKTFRAGTRRYLHVPAGGDPGTAVMSLVGTPQNAAGQVLTTVKDGSPTDMLAVTGGDALPMRHASSMSWASDSLVRDVPMSAVCTENGVGVNVDNSARDEKVDLSVAGKDVSVPAGEKKIFAHKVSEGEAYDIEVREGARSVQVSGTRLCEQNTTVAQKKAGDTSGSAGASEKNSDSSLPLTGSAVLGLLAAGVMITGAGSAAYYFTRKKAA